MVSFRERPFVPDGGKAVKLPSFEMLYPWETYVDRLAFAPGAMADGTTYYAYHTHPVLPVYNPELQWQYSIMREAGMDIRLKGGTDFVVVLL